MQKHENATQKDDRSLHDVMIGLIVCGKIEETEMKTEKDKAEGKME